MRFDARGESFCNGYNKHESSNRGTEVSRRSLSISNRLRGILGGTCSGSIQHRAIRSVIKPDGVFPQRTECGRIMYPIVNRFNLG